MKIIIAGSRSLGDGAVDLVDCAVRLSGFTITEVVCGEARGIDSAGDWWAALRGIPKKSFPAAWRDQHGVYDSAAGFKRNSEMARYADGLIAIWDGRSSGTKHMIDQANRYGFGTRGMIYVYDARPGAVNKPKQS